MTISVRSVPPKKSLGQHFLVDQTHRDRIVAAAELSAFDTVLEIGPGNGVLTERLAVQAGRVIAVELDHRLIDPLRHKFATQPQVQIIHGDILGLDPATLIDAGQETIDSSSATDPKSKIENRNSY